MKISWIFPLICILWIVSEIMLIIFRRSSDQEKNLDAGSLVWLNLVIYGSVAVAVLIAFSGYGFIRFAQNYLAWIGLGSILIGLVIRWMAIATLRQYFTVDVAIQAQHRIVKKGLYKFIRHPAYLGTIVSFLGLGLALSNWLSILLLLIPITIAFIKRIEIEEKALSQIFADEYFDYRRTTWRLIPWLY